MKKGQENLLIFGASARAAAFSALRAGLRPWCADLFGDADLRARCPVIQVPPDCYPQAFAELGRRDLPGPWMYTGALENWPGLVQSLARMRPLWGNDADVLAHARSPFAVRAILRAQWIPCPDVRFANSKTPSQGRWLIKPWNSAGGKHLQFLQPDRPATSSRRWSYLQEYIEGKPCTALYCGDGHSARLIGVTRQLVGEGWLHAAPFHYCGSIGPLRGSPCLHEALKKLGTALSAGCGLRGLFGVDCVMRDDIPWPVEVNPRYTASIEVLEHALGISALALHQHIFDPGAARPLPRKRNTASPVVGKAILFARATLTFPQDGPWAETLRQPVPIDTLPAFADIPHVGEVIEAGRPVLTFFARAGSDNSCMDELRRTAADLDRWLFAR